MSLKSVFVVLLLLTAILFGMAERRTCAGWVSAEDEIHSGFQPAADESNSGTAAASAIDSPLNDLLPKQDVPPALQDLFTFAAAPQQTQESSTSSSVSPGSSPSAFAAFFRNADQPPPLIARAVVIAAYFHPRLMVAEIFRPPQG